MNIIIEGPDGAGKSYLAEQLAEQLNLRIVHFVAPTDEFSQFDMYRDFLIDAKNVILDRAWYSDMVYGPIFRGKAEIRSDAMWELERGAEDTIVIYCTGPVHAMWLAAQERGETFVENYNQYQEICRCYDEVMLQMYHEIPVHVREAIWLQEKTI